MSKRANIKRLYIFRRIFGSIIIIILVVIGFIISLMFGIPAYTRYQAVANANNQTAINNKIIAQTEQLVNVEQQKAKIKIVEAEGIAAAQKIINETLTDKYLQHEAIGAQIKMAGSPNHTQIYIPSGPNGIPLVKTIE